MQPASHQGLRGVTALLVRAVLGYINLDFSRFQGTPFF